MFCQCCGSWLQKRYGYCPSCGIIVKRPSADSCIAEKGSSSAPSVSPCLSTNGPSNHEETKLLSFNRFAAKKSEERQAMSFRPKAKKARKMEAEEVTVNIGVMVNKSDGDVQVLRGKSLPLRTKKGASSYDILEAAIKKRKDYDRSFFAYSDPAVSMFAA